MKKIDKKTENMLKDRMEWLKKWLKLRKYDLGDKGRDFLVIYYCTIRNLYGADFAQEMLLRMNNTLEAPLSEEIVLSHMKKVDSKNGYNYRNETIIQKLGITEEEADILKIGHHMIEEQERSHRMFEKFLLSVKIVEMYLNGIRIVDIAKAISECSKSSIERILKEPAKEKTEMRNREILEMRYVENIDENKIAEEYRRRHQGDRTDQKTVQKILRENPSNLLITETTGTKEVTTTYQATGDNEFFLSLHKTEISVSTVDSYEQALHDLRSSSNNIFLYGGAGTAKSTLLTEFLEGLTDEEKATTLVVAPTGVAAEHINGQTINRAFGLPIGVQCVENLPKMKKQLYLMNRIVIEEVSMVRIDYFEAIIHIVKEIEQKENKHIQVIVCGDYGQIAPVVTKEDREELQKHYQDTSKIYAFQSELWNELHFQKIKLTYVFRQEDQEFAEKLTEIKYGLPKALEWFNQHVNRYYDPKAIFICARNVDVDCYNEMMLNRFWREMLPKYEAQETNVSATDTLPCPKILELTKGVRVMTICNDKDYQNGSLGTVSNVRKHSIEVLLDNGKKVNVKRKKFHLESGGVYEQFPLVYGWAITANKSQGKTFDAVVIVRGKGGFFSAGQLYVALSRCKNADKLCLLEKLTQDDLICDEEALRMTI